MHDTALVPALIAASFLALAAGIAWWQHTRATRCPAHHPVLGRFAWLLVVACCVAATALTLITIDSR